MNDEPIFDETFPIAPPDVSRVPAWLLDAIDDMADEGRWQEFFQLLQRLERTLQ